MYSYDNRTPEFVLPQRVSYDNTPAAATYSTLGGARSPLEVETEPFGVTRHTFDADLRATPWTFGTAGIGFTRQTEDRTHRVIEDTHENIVRLTYDARAAQWLQLRTKYEHGQKRGDVAADGALELFNIGEQPAVRHFDIASRDRDRLTVLASVMPTGSLALSGSIAVGKDDYLESTFGLRDNTHRVYTAGFDAAAAEHVTFGLSYSFERYKSLQRSRQVGSPPSGANVLTFEQFLDMSSSPNPTQAIADPRFDWAANGTDRVHTAIASLDVLQIRNRVDVRLSYDYSRARALYTYAIGRDIPRILPDDIEPLDSALPPPSQLPLIRSELQRATADAVVSLTPRFGIGVSYWYEKFSVADFTLDVDANTDPVTGDVAGVRTGALLLGYLYRPYTANTVSGRLIVRF
jgi:hypothetical protein